MPVDVLMVFIYLVRLARTSWEGNTGGMIWALLMTAFWAYWVDRDLRERRRAPH